MPAALLGKAFPNLVTFNACNVRSLTATVLEAFLACGTTRVTIDAQPYTGAELRRELARFTKLIDELRGAPAKCAQLSLGEPYEPPGSPRVVGLVRDARGRWSCVVS